MVSVRLHSHRELLVHTPPQLQRELQATTLRRKIVPTYEIGKMGREMREPESTDVIVLNFTRTYPGIKMANSNTTTEHVGEAEAALLDAELFIKYKAPEKAIRCLRSALDVDPRSIPLRERLREISATHQQKEEAARQCLALAKLYIERDDFDRAHDRLLEAKRYDARINIAGGLEAIRRARRPDLQPVPTAEATPDRPQVTLAGDLSAISVFDAIQVIENAKLTGTLILSGDAKSGNVIFNEGKIVDAEAAGLSAEAGFRQIVEITGGGFEFQKSQHEFPIKISSPTNTNLILDTLRRLDEENQQ